ncbi:cell division cycle-associated protein 2 isoform X2 [Clinocottus analis]|uniref:cell division cycle-associated protein 2 isoform X2 n=1 Tax=Clinocottus analis TaxID=304258 RepID=UPI0035C04CD3
MATAEIHTEGDQTEKMLPPSEEDSPPVLNDTSSTLNFSELTPLQFGISSQSFTPASLSKSKDKSRIAQLKARRRSGVGVRGSPETNSLILFMSRQRMKTPPTLQTPELVRGSPFLPRVASTLRQKMASFQSLMDVEESEVCDPMPRQDSNTGGCTKTRDYLSDRNSHDGGKENHPPMITPIPSKRRRLGPIEGCEVEIREDSAPILHLSLKKQEEEEPVMSVVTQGSLPSSETVEQAQAVHLSSTLHIDLELSTSSPAKNQQDDVFELQSPLRPPPDDSAATSPARPAPLLDIPFLPSLLEMNPTGDEDSTMTPTVKKKKKRVCFGGPLSPEFFDKNLPPSTPLQKGSAPTRAPTPGGILQPRSVLKTPQRIESQTTQAQPDLSSPTVFGASPTLAMPRHRRMPSVGDDSEEKDGERLMASTLMEEIDFAWAENTECTWEAQPLNLNAAFHEESLSQFLTESETNPSTTSNMDALDESRLLPEKEKPHEAGVQAPTQSRNQRNKRPRPEHAPSSEAPARSSRKRKPEESEPVKRSTRCAAKTASGKMKRNSAAARRWIRDVDRSLYGSREYASKNPALSPITERLSLIGPSQAAQQIPCTSCTAPNHDMDLNPEMANDTLAIGDLPLTNALKNSSEDFLTSLNSDKDKTAGKCRRASGPRVRWRGQKKRKVSVAMDTLLSEETLDQSGGKAQEHCDDQSTANLEASRETPFLIVNTEHIAQISADTFTLCTDTDGTLECLRSPDAPASDCPPSAGESHDTLSQSAERKAMKVERESSVNVSEPQEKGDQAAIQQDNIRSSSGSQGDVEVADLHLASWQADFNFEDVFKPVANRIQVRSVRRSLRNQNNAEHSSNSAGLAWLAWTSPDSNKNSRRRTRGRRLSAAPPIQPSLPEETQDNVS